jgi:hypothetical protein
MCIIARLGNGTQSLASLWPIYRINASKKTSQISLRGFLLTEVAGAGLFSNHFMEDLNFSLQMLNSSILFRRAQYAPTNQLILDILFCALNIIPGAGIYFYPITLIYKKRHF